MTKIIKRLLRSFLALRWVRPIFIYRYYRNVISAGENVVALRRKESEIIDDEFWAARLRKHSHILDKGLQRSDFEPGHGLLIYENAKQILSHIKSISIRNDPSVAWSIRKIDTYKKRQRSDRLHEQPPVRSARCSYSQLNDLIRTRRSIRRFRKQRVDSETVRKIVEVIDWSPTSCNRQTARVYATNNFELAQECLALCPGSSGFNKNIPLFLCFCSDFRAYEMATEIMLPYIDVALGIQNCNLAAHTMGISITMLTWAQHSNKDEKELRRLLDIPDYCQIIVNAVAGYPECGVETPARKNLSTTLQLRH